MSLRVSIVLATALVGAPGGAASIPADGAGPAAAIVLPEPMSLALLGLGILGVSIYARWRRTRSRSDAAPATEEPAEERALTRSQDPGATPSEEPPTSRKR